MPLVKGNTIGAETRFKTGQSGTTPQAPSKLGERELDHDVVVFEHLRPMGREVSLMCTNPFRVLSP